MHLYVKNILWIALIVLATLLFFSFVLRLPFGFWHIAMILVGIYGIIKNMLALRKENTVHQQ
ncbi:hypothetical protein ACFO4L_01140 [Bacillus daqingensis]|uniref:Uncharacterized protein n=1 Tax=Bacillus daqingensis TaxID=872396 RepID=A0ABV9NS84_9BACI